MSPNSLSDKNFLESISEDTDLTILLAEDDEEDQLLLKEALEEIDNRIKVHVVSDGEKALKYLNKQSGDKLPCLIVLDYNMPGLNGQEVLRAICQSERYKSIPKIIWSTSNSEKHIHDCIATGATTYFVKPFNVLEIKNQAREMINFCKNAA
ncbi:MAG: response regulator [Chitinophagaceae bacterium]|nr:response regulator [Chitinophagaceae bacterium]